MVAVGRKSPPGHRRITSRLTHVSHFKKSDSSHVATDFVGTARLFVIVDWLVSPVDLFW